MANSLSLCGGLSYSSRHDIYSVSGDSWSSGTIWPNSYRGMGGSEENLAGDFVLTGGTGPVTAVSKYTRSSSAWSSLTAMDTAVAQHGAHGNGVDTWAFGGVVSGADVSSQIQKRVNASDTWSSAGSLVNARGYNTVASAGDANKLVNPCGSLTGPVATALTEEYTTSTSVSAALTSASTATYGKSQAGEGTFGSATYMFKTAGSAGTHTEVYNQPSDSWGSGTAAGSGSDGNGLAHEDKNFFVNSTGTSNQEVTYPAGSWTTKTARPINDTQSGGSANTPLPIMVGVVGYWGYATGTPSTSTVLLVHADGPDTSTYFPDSSDSRHALTAVGNAQVDTSYKKWGTGALILDGTGDYVTIPNSSDFDFSSNFTVECWYRHGAGTSAVMLANCPGTAATVGWAFLLSSGALYFQVSNGAGGWSVQASKSWTPSAGTWYHLAATRFGDTIRTFVNGVAGTGAALGSSISSSNSLYIGAYTNAATLVNGHIDEIYIVNGVALYTDDFQVPTAAHTEVVSEWYQFSDSAIETGSDYGFDVLPGSGKTIYWNPSSEPVPPDGTLQVKIVRDS